MLTQRHASPLCPLLAHLHMKIVLEGADGNCARNRYRPHLESAARSEEIGLILIDLERPSVPEPHENIVSLGINEDRDEIARLTGIDVVIIAIPDRFHIPKALEWQGRARHVVIEKPLADSSESASQLVAALGVRS